MGAPAPRRLGVDDRTDVTTLLDASDRAVLGYPDFTTEEISADLRRGDLEAYGWYDDDGTLVGYGWVAPVDGSDKAEVDAYVLPSHDDRLGLAVLEHLEERGRALVAAAGHDSVMFDIGAYRGDEKTRSWLAARGYQIGTSFTRMRIDFDDLAHSDSVAVGDRVRIRRSDGSAEDWQTAHRIAEESFLDHYGHVPTGFTAWRERVTSLGDEWSEIWLADLDGEPVGVLVGNRQFEPDENAGYVRTIGTLPKARGTGVARSLLRAYFEACRAAGRGAVLLHVDVANVTNALRLYESVGMRAVLEIDAWAKRVPVSRD